MSKNILTISKRTFCKRAKIDGDVNKPCASSSINLSFYTDAELPHVEDDVHNVRSSDDTTFPAEVDAEIPATSNIPTPLKEDAASFLQSWYRDFNISHQALSALLKFLNRNGFSELPNDSRSLLQTPKQRDVVSMPPGNYIHIGLNKAITFYLKCSEFTPSELTIDINIDGVPISKSSNSSFWLILAKLFSENTPQKIFVVGVYHGNKKPANFNNFLEPFISEAKTLPQFKYNNIHIPINLRCIICDAPARNSCLGNKSYNGYFGCGRCVQEGEFKTRMTYPELFSEKRSNESFRLKLQPEHHLRDSAFLELPIDMIKQFPVEYQHAVCLGVTKRSVKSWVHGGSKMSVKLRSDDIQKIASRLALIAKWQPSEFQRKCRSFEELHNFKASEFRALILYILPVAVKDIVAHDVYENMLVLHVAMMILVDPCLCKSHSSVAQELLEYFVKSFGEIYGSDQLVYNVHSLLHMVDDVNLYGSLDNYSAFPFESYMYKIKKMMRKNNDCLSQISNRIEEQYLIDTKYKIKNNTQIEFKRKDKTSEIYKEIRFPGFKIKNTPRDQWFLTSDGNVFKFAHVQRSETGDTVYACKIVNKTEFYTRPVSSIEFNVYKSDGKLSEIVQLDITHVKNKVFAMPLDHHVIFAPLRHSN